MIAGLLFLSPVPAWVPPTLESETSPRLEYACRVAGNDFVAKNLRFKTLGDRGYRATDGTFRSTPLQYAIMDDETGRFRSLTFRKVLVGRRGAEFGSDEVYVWIEEVTPTMNAQVSENVWKASLVVTFDFGRTVERMVGFCDVSSIEQNPLSARETREFLAQ